MMHWVSYPGHYAHALMATHKPDSVEGGGVAFDGAAGAGSGEARLRQLAA
jgi:hypothetical protein